MHTCTSVFADDQRSFISLDVLIFVMCRKSSARVKCSDQQTVHTFTQAHGPVWSTSYIVRSTEYGDVNNENQPHVVSLHNFSGKST